MNPISLPSLMNADKNPNTQDAFGRQLKGRKKGRFWKGVGILSLLAIAGGVGFALFTKEGQILTEQTTKWAPPLYAAKQNPNLLFDSVGDSHVNVLLVGKDRNWKVGKVYDPTTKTYRSYQVEDTQTPARSDTMIVMSLDKETRALRLISFPRDSRMTYLDFDGKRHRYVKLNSVYAEPKGQELLKKVFGEELGIRVDRVMEIKLDGFTKLIDQVGGIFIDVEGGLWLNRRTGKEYRGAMKYEDKWGGWKVDLQPGPQLLNGEQAHGYVRFRKDRESDPGRVRRQQQVMRALAKKLMNLGLMEMPGAIQEIQKQFSTDLSDEELISAAMFARGLGDSGKITPLTPYGTLESDGDIKLNRPENEKLFAAIFGTSFDKSTFLKLSPETKGDDIGKRNNDNPAALPILREAGLIEENAPVRNGATDAPGLQ